MKKILCVLIILLQLVALFSMDITATGYGVSKEEAKTNALSELSTSIRANVSSITTLNLDDSTSSLSHKSNITTNTELYGIVFGTPQLGLDQVYSVTATIPEKTASYYKIQIQELESNLINFNLQYSSGDLITDFEYFKSSYENMNLYDTYAYILSLLTDGKWQSTVSFPVSKAEIKMKYTSSISSYITELSGAVEGMELAKMRRALTEQEQLFLDRSAEKIKLIKKEYEANIEERNNYINDIKSNLSVQQQDYINKLLQIDSKNRMEAKDFSAQKTYVLLKDIQTYYSEIISMLTSTLSDIENQFLDERIGICNDEYKKDYLPIECFKGRPNDEAIKARINKVSRIVEEYRQAYAHNSINFIEEAFDSLNLRRTDFIEILKAGSNKNYTNDNVTGDLYVHIDRFSQSDNKWHGQVSGSILGEPIIYDFDFSYEDWTGKTPSAITDATYEEYMLDVQYLSDILTKIECSYIIEISYRINVDWEHKTYCILIDKMTIKDPIADRNVKEYIISEEILTVDFSSVFTPFTAYNTLISIKEIIPEEYAGIQLSSKNNAKQQPEIAKNESDESYSISQQWISDSVHRKGHKEVGRSENTNNQFSMTFTTTGEISLQEKLELFETLFFEYEIPYTGYNLHTMLGLGFNFGIDSGMIEQVYTAIGAKIQTQYIDCYFVLSLGGLVDESLYDSSSFIAIPYVAIGNMWSVSSDFDMGIFGKFGYEISDRKNNTINNKFKYGVSVEMSYSF